MNDVLKLLVIGGLLYALARQSGTTATAITPSGTSSSASAASGSPTVVTPLFGSYEPGGAGGSGGSSGGASLASIIGREAMNSLPLVRGFDGRWAPNPDAQYFGYTIPGNLQKIRL